MKSSAPWSVKGIERDARETAKEAAKREGMTVGEWLNQMIYSAGEAQMSGGEVEGLKLRDIVTAIDHLHKRVADGQTENASAVAEMSHKVGDVVERVQRLERVKPEDGSSGALAARLERLEQSGSGERERVNALKALEKAVAQVAVQFNTAQKTSMQRLDGSERQLQELAARIDAIGDEEAGASDVNFLKDTIDGLSARIARAERIASEAAKLKESAQGSADAEFMETTGNRLRVLGDEIKRGGDQIRALETTIGKLSGQIDAAERRSAEGIQKVSETIAELRENLSAGGTSEPNRADIDAAVAAATQQTDERVSALQRSLDDMAAQFDAIRAEPASVAEREPVSEPDDDGAVEAEGAALASEIEAFAPEAPLDPAPAEPAPEAPMALEPPAAADDDAVDAHEDAGEIEEDEDPFAFADEIDAALEDQTNAAENQDDDFKFELDGDAEEAAGPDDVEEAVSVEDAPEPENEAQRLLSEVKAVFGEGAPKADAPEPEAADTVEDDLDAILADLDDDPEPVEPPPLASEIETFKEEPAAEAEDAPAAKDDADHTADSEKTADSVKSVRRHAVEAGQQRSLEDKKTLRRHLTPKQKAILAARARQKRLAAEIAEAGASPAPDPQKVSAARDALLDKGEEAEQPGEEKPAEEKKDGLSQISAAVAALSAKLPFIGKKSDAETPAASAPEQPESEKPAPDKDVPQPGDKAAFETLKATASARPVTLALAVGIFLSIAALFYLVKDIVFPPSGTQSPVTAVEPAAEPAAPEAEAAAVESSAPAIDPRTLYMDAMATLSAPDSDNDAITAAVETLEEAAALGHPPAQLQLGEFYKTGQGVDQDLVQARVWFRRAANGGNILAMHRIGVMTARGDGGPADTDEAIGWFERAGNLGLVDSQYNLGAIFHPSTDGGASTVQDAGKAYYWYSLAARNGDEQASPLAEGVAALLTAEERQGLDETIAEWETLPADQAANELAQAGAL